MPFTPKVLVAQFLGLSVLVLVPILPYIADPLVHKIPMLIVTLSCVVVIALSGAFYQGGLFGFADLFPPRYTVALMSGNGVAGVLASILTIVTTAAFPNNNNGSLEGAAMNEEGAEIINPKTKIPIDTDQ